MKSKATENGCVRESLKGRGQNYHTAHKRWTVWAVDKANSSSSSSAAVSVVLGWRRFCFDIFIFLQYNSRETSYPGMSITKTPLWGGMFCCCCCCCFLSRGVKPERWCTAGTVKDCKKSLLKLIASRVQNLALVRFRLLKEGWLGWLFFSAIVRRS